MPKSKSRRHPKKKNKSGITTAVKTETSEAAKATSAAASSTTIEKRKMEVQPHYPYLKKELVKIGIVTAVTLLALIILALVFK